MILLANIDGTLTDVTNEPIYRGASNVNEILLIAPFVKSSVVTLYATLPNGVELPPAFAKATNIPTFAGLFTATGVALNAWSYKLQFALTQLAGELTLQFAITHTNGTTTTSQIVKQILPGSGFTDPGETGEGFESIQQAVLAAQTAAAEAEDAADRARGWEASADSYASQADSRASDAEAAARSAETNRSQAESAKNAAKTSETNAYLAEGSARDARDRAEGFSISAGLEANRAQTEANRAASEANRAQGYAESLNVDNLLPKSAFDLSRIYNKTFSSEALGLWLITDLYAPFPDTLAGLFNLSWSISAVDNNGSTEYTSGSYEIVYADEFTVTEAFDDDGEIIKLSISKSTKLIDYLQANPNKTITATLNLRVILKTL